MSNSQLISTILICPACKTHLKRKSEHLYVCKCSEHPFLDDILCIYHPDLERKKRAVEYLKNNQVALARKTLVGKKYYYLLQFFSSPFIPLMVGRFLTIILLSLLFVDARMWFKYVLFRRKNRTYQIATKLVHRLKKEGIFVDLGIGSGEIMSEIIEHNHFKEYIGFDFSYQNLYFAKRTALENKNVLMVCSDLSLKFPLISNLADLSLTTETLNYIPNIPHFMKEVIRITSQNGIACMTSIHNVGFNIPTNSISPQQIRKMIPTNMKTTIITDEDIFNMLVVRKKFYNSLKKNLVENSSYSLLLRK